MENVPVSVAAQLAEIHDRIAEAAQRAPLAAQHTTLVAVSKTHPAERVREALLAGQRVFGENRVQEAQGKWPALREEFPDIQLHLIGPLQTNKAKEAVALFDVIETLDRPKLANTLASIYAERGGGPELYIQVNTGEEPQKAGIAPAEVEDFLAYCRDEKKLPVTGLMCIPPHDEKPSPHFALLYEMAKRLELPTLSMGMSGDFEAAIRLGATHVRVGTAIFGQRD